MITKEIAANLQKGNILTHTTETNRKGALIQCRVNGKTKTWKRNPARFEIPVKRGLSEFGYVTEQNADKWSR